MGRASVINPRQSVLDNDGVTVLNSGTLTFYVNESTKLATIYSDPELNTTRTNPYTLTAQGLIDGDLFFDDTLSMLVKDSSGAFVRMEDDVTCFNASPSFEAWVSTLAYGNGGENIVTASDGNYYVSIQASNLGNDPVSSPLWWKMVSFIDGDNTTIDAIAALTPSRGGLITGTSTTWEGSETLAAIKPNKVYGLELSNGSDADHDIDIAVGRCSDSTNVLSMSLSSAFTKQIDATWAAGTNQGGLASGATLGNNTWYHVFVVDVAAATDVMFDTSVTCANGVANNSVDYFKRVGSVLTDGSANIIGFFQSGDRFYWDVFVNDSSTNNPGTDTVTVVVSVPTGVEVNALCYISALQESDSTEPTISMVGGGYATPTPTTARKRIICSAVPTGEKAYYEQNVKVLTNTSAQIIYESTSSNTDLTVDINTVGWIDSRSA